MSEKKPEFEFNGKKYVFDELCIGQVEIISELLHNSRRQLLESLTAEGKKDMLQAMRIAVNVSEIMQELKRTKKYTRFIAACVKPEGQTWSEEEYEKNARLFKGLPDRIAQEVAEFFFTGEGFVNLLIPKFLQGAAATREDTTR
ncbi:MAG: hypothetical protein Kow0037_00640 [Calditrichia bacterium]